MRKKYAKLFGRLKGKPYLCVRITQICKNKKNLGHGKELQRAHVDSFQGDEGGQ